MAAAVLYAARNLPKDHSLLLIHGVHHMWRRDAGLTERDQEEMHDIEDHYEALCHKTGRDCSFKHFAYTSTTGFGDRACKVSQTKYQFEEGVL